MTATLHDGGSPEIYINVRPNAVSVMVDGSTVYTFDRAGRILTAVIEDRTYRRGLDNRMLEIRRAAGTHGSGRRTRRLDPGEARHVVEGIQQDVGNALAAVTSGSAWKGPEGLASPEAALWLRRIGGVGWDALVADAGKLAKVYRPVSILPPDQYLALVIQVTEGCGFNRCTFCSLYRDRPFRVKTRAELREHTESVLMYFGEGISIRKSVFLADANAMCIPDDVLLPMLDDVNSVLPLRATHPGGHLKGIYSFVDAFSDRGPDLRRYEAMRDRNVRRLYLGVETGCGSLLRFLHKPQSPGNMRDTMLAIKDAGLDLGVIIMLGIGGDRFSTRHVDETLDLLAGIPWGAGDLIFLSPLVEQAGSEYSILAGQAGIRGLSEDGMSSQGDSLREGIRRIGGSPRIALYGIEEFMY